MLGTKKNIIELFMWWWCSLKENLHIWNILNNFYTQRTRKCEKFMLQKNKNKKMKIVENLIIF